MQKKPLLQTDGSPERLKTPITYWGGKQSMIDDILPNIAEHVCFVSLFTGGAAIEIAKKPSKNDVWNDLNRFVMNFYEQLKTNPTNLERLIWQTPMSFAAYQDAKVAYKYPHLFTPLYRAWAFWVLTNEGWCGKIGTWGYGTKDQKKEVSLAFKRKYLHEKLKEYEARLDLTQLECRDALYVLAHRDRPDTFFYADPPYIDTYQGHYEGYKRADFIQLLTAFEGLKGKFLMSSYESDILTEFTKRNGWYTVKIKKMLSSTTERRTKVEVLTANYPIFATRQGKREKDEGGAKHTEIQKD